MDHRSDSTFFLMVVILITGGLFAPIVGFGFNLATDDVLFVLQNPFVKDTSFKGFLAVVTSPGHIYGEIQPIPYLSLWIDHAFFGMRAWGYYVVQILLHLVNVVLVFLVIRSVSGNELIGLVTAMIFAIHPLQVDTVAMVNQRKTLLAGLFLLCSISAYLRWNESGSKPAYAYSMILFVLAMLSKSSAVVLPLLIILTNLLKPERLNVRAGLRWAIPFFLPAFLFGVVTILTESAAEQVHSLKFGTLIGQLKLMLLIYGDYFLSFFWPLNLSPAYIYKATDFDSAKMAAAVLFCAAVMIFLMVGIKKRCWWLVLGIGWFVICLLPTSQLIPTTNLRQDHYMYLALVGPALMIGGGVNFLVSGWDARKLYLPVILTITAVLGPLTFLHLEHYSTGLKYCERMEQTQGWVPALESIRGRVFLIMGEYRAAEGSYMKTIESFGEPLKSRERYQLAQVYLRMGRPSNAIEQLEMISAESPLKNEADQIKRDLRGIE